MKRTALQHITRAKDALFYAAYRFPPDVIGYSVWPYCRFLLSLCMVEELLGAQGIDLTYETVRRGSVSSGLGIRRRIRSTALDIMSYEFAYKIYARTTDTLSR